MISIYLVIKKTEGIKLKDIVYEAHLNDPISEDKLRLVQKD